MNPNRHFPMGPREGGGPGWFEHRGEGPGRFRENFDNASAAFGGGGNDWLLWVIFALVLVLLLLSIASLLASGFRLRLVPAFDGPRVAGGGAVAAEPPASATPSAEAATQTTRDEKES